MDYVSRKSDAIIFYNDKKAIFDTKKTFSRKFIAIAIAFEKWGEGE